MSSLSTSAEPNLSTLIPLDEILTRVGVEMFHLASTMDDFQSLISPLIVIAGHHDRHFLRKVQDFDHIAQKLNCLSDYLAALAAQLPRDWRIDPNIASETVTLAELSNRLSARQYNSKPEIKMNSGDCELF